MKTLKEIMYEYANTRGGGLPLTAEEICNSVVLWVQQYVGEDIDILRRILTIDPITGSIKDGKIEISLEKSTLEADFADGNFISAYDLAERIKGSESIVVDVAEGEKSIEIHLDGEIISTLGRAVLIPISNPSEPKVAVLGVNGAIEWEPVSSFIGGTKLYVHSFNLLVRAGSDITCRMEIISSFDTPLTLPAIASPPDYIVNINGSFTDQTNGLYYMVVGLLGESVLAFDSLSGIIRQYDILDMDYDIVTEL